MRPCIGQHRLFDSIHAADHAEAKAICDTCPVIDWCREQLEAAREAAASSTGGGPVGTWAGELVGVIDREARAHRNEIRRRSRERVKAAGVRLCRACNDPVTGGTNATTYCSDPCRAEGKRAADRRARVKHRAKKKEDADVTG